MAGSWLNVLQLLETKPRLITAEFHHRVSRYFAIFLVET